MSKATEAIKYLIAVWDEVQGNWRETPDHVQRKFLEAEAELNEEKTLADELAPIDNPYGILDEHDKFVNNLKGARTNDQL